MEIAYTVPERTRNLALNVDIFFRRKHGFGGYENISSDVFLRARPTRLCRRMGAGEGTREGAGAEAGAGDGEGEGAGEGTDAVWLRPRGQCVGRLVIFHS